MGEQKPLGKTPLRGNPSLEMTYPTYLLGLMGWYQVYIKGFAELAEPLMNAVKGKYQYEAKDPNEPETATRMPKKRTKIKPSPKEACINCTDEMKQNFELLKKALDDQTRLYLPKSGLPWRIITNTSNSAVGGVLEQKQEDDNWHPVAFLLPEATRHRSWRRWVYKEHRAVCVDSMGAENLSLCVLFAEVSVLGPQLGG